MKSFAKLFSRRKSLSKQSIYLPTETLIEVLKYLSRKVLVQKVSCLSYYFRQICQSLPNQHIISCLFMDHDWKGQQKSSTTPSICVMVCSHQKISKFLFLTEQSFAAEMVEIPTFVHIENVIISDLVPEAFIISCSSYNLTMFSKTSSGQQHHIIKGIFGSNFVPLTPLINYTSMEELVERFSKDKNQLCGGNHGDNLASRFLNLIKSKSHRILTFSVLEKNTGNH
uniref:F-box domain-containing protein n=1 Tax=Ditylenchus dipsaci TaxID=166011 RepID=A0A915DCH4_9BILA